MILWIETASQSRLHAQECKIIRRDDKQPHPRRLRRAGEIIFVEPGRRNVFENSGMLKILPLRLGKSYVLRADTGQIILNAYQLLRLRVRQRLQQRRVHHAKDCSGRSNAQGEREDDDCGEARRLAQHAKAETHVLYQSVDKIPGDRFPAFFFEALWAPELDARATLGLAPLQSGTLKIISAALNVCAKFL